MVERSGVKVEVELSAEQVTVLKVLESLIKHGWGKLEVEVNSGRVVSVAKRETYLVS